MAESLKSLEKRRAKLGKQLSKSVAKRGAAVRKGDVVKSRSLRDEQVSLMAQIAALDARIRAMRRMGNGQR